MKMATAIMVIETNQTSRELLVDYLNKRFSNVIALPAGDIEMALAMLSVFTPDIITINYTLDPLHAEKNGLALAKRIRKDCHYKGKIILVSGGGYPPLQDEPESASIINGFVSKPFEIGKLGAVLGLSEA